MHEHKQKVALALQGAGSHGAFTWGVLRSLLDLETIDIQAISGSSSGALTGAALCSGWAKGIMAEQDPRISAKAAIDKLWTDIGHLSNWSGLQATWLDKWLGSGNMQFSPAFQMVDWAMRMGHPAQYNPFDFNPMPQLISQNIDFNILAKTDDPSMPELYVNMTHVQSGESYVFGRKDLSIDILRASGCIPFLQNPVYIDNEAYWDGGYSANPSFDPFLDLDIDILYVISPLASYKKNMPATSSEVMDRLTEISNQAVCRAQIQMLQSKFENLSKDVKIIKIHPKEEMSHLDISSKLNTEITFLRELRQFGEKAVHI